MQKKVVINNKETVYIITENGELFNSKTKRWYKGTIVAGYKRYDLTVDGKKYSRQVHRLVAEAFIPNPNNLPVVNHIDGNKLNNNINNLEWVTYSENLSHAYNTGLKLKDNGVMSRIKDDQLYGKEWKQYKDTNYYISPEGYMKNIKTGNIMKGKIRNDGYVEWCLTIDGKKHSKIAHRLVFETYLGELKPDLVINHIDGDKTNNNINNLEQITKSENVLHAQYITKKKKLKKVAKIDMDNNILDIYESCADAARKNEGCYPNLISNVCNGITKTHKGYKWKYLEEE